MTARMSAKLMWGPDVISGFLLEQSFHSSTGGPGNFLERSFHSACGRAGNFSLPVQRKVTKRKHVAWRPRFYAWLAEKLRRCQLRIRRSSVTALEQLSYVIAIMLLVWTESLVGTRIRCPSLVDREGARLRRFSRRKTWGVTQRVSFLVTFFFARAKKEVTRSSAGGVEALLVDREPKKELNDQLRSWKPRLRGNDELGECHV
jgi:hypothetical protein